MNRLYVIKGVHGDDRRRLIAVFMSLLDGAFGVEERGGVLVSIPGPEAKIKVTARKEARRFSKDATVEMIIVTQKPTQESDAYFTAIAAYPNDGAQQIASYKLRKLDSVRRTFGNQIETFGRPAENLPEVIETLKTVGGRLR